MKLTLQRIRIAAGPDEEGALVFADGRLVAVLVRLSAIHADLEGDWFLETGYGPLSGPDHHTFASLDTALEWMSDRLAGARIEGRATVPRPHRR